MAKPKPEFSDNNIGDAILASFLSLSQSKVVFFEFFSFSFSLFFFYFISFFFKSFFLSFFLVLFGEKKDGSDLNVGPESIKRA